MCGIVGFTGRQQAAPILLNGLSKLEYRGYDSAGIAVREGEHLAQVVKAKGRLSNLVEKTDEGKALLGTCGIGHTRWATHGEPSQINAHPHVSGNCTRSGSGEVESEVVGVHNGIIENYTELKEKLLKHGYTFYSQTDTEVVIKLVDYYYKKYNLGPIDAIAKTMVRVRGSYALELMFKDYPGEIWVARKDSPMIIGVTDGETYVASDVPAILKYTRNVYYIGNLEFARLTPGEAHFYNLDGDEIEKQTTEIKWNAEAAEKAGFEHFMMKEIHEQPKAVRDTLGSVIKDNAIDLSSVELTEDEILGFDQIYIVACGSAWHVGMAAQYVIEDLADIPVRVELASEFRYRIHKPEEIDTIKRFCDKHNLTPIAIGSPQFWLKNYVACSPFQCLKIFQNADFVITDTFHGTIFAAKYAPKYAVLIRDSNRNKLLDLIKKIKIEKHLIENMEEIEKKFSCKKDIVGFQKIIEMERRKTRIYLEQEIRRQKD